MHLWMATSELFLYLDDNSQLLVCIVFNTLKFFDKISNSRIQPPLALAIIFILLDNKSTSSNPSLSISYVSLKVR